MIYETTADFPTWVHDYNIWGSPKGWPKEFQALADSLYEKADEVAMKWRGAGLFDTTYTNNDSPYTQCEIDNHMGADNSRYESRPVYCCNEGIRPDEWNLLYDSNNAKQFSRGDIHETKIGNWYFVLGEEYD